MNWVDTILQGVMLGGLYALFAVGQSLLLGVMRLTNVAHGDFLILGSFAGFALIGGVPGTPLGGFGLNPAVTMLILLPLAASFGYGLQRGVLNGTLGADPMPSLVVTFGLSIVIQNLLLEIFSADNRSISALGVETRSLALGAGIHVGMLPLIIFILALAATVFMEWLFRRTHIGRAFRATSDDYQTAQLMGLDHRHVYALATAIAFALIAVAGMLQGMRTVFAPSDGPGLLLYAFEAVIIGGLGSFWGSFAGGIILGVSQSVGFRIDPGWGILIGHVVFLAMLMIRPSGLFPKTR
ncbi:MAG: branched-chain amino acid ABC transporter permease [Betaproteobacteria bacterium]|nr:branched-chain amino acid ABC transporter permease [Betaproteobacteria bacterium]